MLAACGPLLLPSGLCICQPDAEPAAPSPKQVAKACSHGHCHKADPPRKDPPQPKKHTPGCPSELASVDRSPGTDSAATVSTVLQVAPAIDSVIAPPQPAHPVRHELPSYVPSTPVYLSHCALVI
jgi:hypothetical protein